ncbi:YbaB/EbfC family nucleoid-associated protein [Streptosporangium sp. KLBMP 9127]|nr:YbaB/EbfC family nucleoid-associated protein [Streptosporangium sp. KLBMP 9127]
MKHIGTFNEDGKGDVGSLLGEVGGWMAGLTETLREAGEQRMEGADPTGQVVAKVSGSGQLLGLSIDPRAMRDLDHLAMAETVVQAIGAARLASAEHLTQALEDMAGAQSAVGAPSDPLKPYIDAVLREG